MKIAFHGSFGGEINPDYRDLNQSEASKKVVKFVQDFVADYFPGLEHENGPALLESCIYTVSFRFEVSRPIEVYLKASRTISDNS